MPKQPPFRFVPAWQCLTDADAEAIQAFWLREQANVEGEAAARRVHQAVMRVVTADGELAAVSTAEVRTIPRLLQPMYYYRCFVGAAWRSHKVLRPLLCGSFDVLEDWARAHAYPSLGVLLELENEGFGESLQRAHWRVSPKVGFTFIGRSAKGQDLRVCYFPGARLKTLQEVQELLHQAPPAHAATG